MISLLKCYEKKCILWILQQHTRSGCILIFWSCNNKVLFKIWYLLWEMWVLVTDLSENRRTEMCLYIRVKLNCINNNAI